MRASLTALLLCFAVLVAGCGGGDDKPKTSDAEAKVIAAYNAANTAFKNGDYAKTCTHYTVELVAQVIKDTKTKNCMQAFKAIAENLKKAEPDAAVRDAILSYAPDAAKITGNRALAHFGKPPAAVMKAHPNTAQQGTVELRQTKDGNWLIATFTVAG